MHITHPLCIPHPGGSELRLMVRCCGGVGTVGIGRIREPNLKWPSYASNDKGLLLLRGNCTPPRNTPTCGDVMCHSKVEKQLSEKKVLMIRKKKEMGRISGKCCMMKTEPKFGIRTLPSLSLDSPDNCLPTPTQPLFPSAPVNMFQTYRLYMKRKRERGFRRKCKTLGLCWSGRVGNPCPRILCLQSERVPHSECQCTNMYPSQEPHEGRSLHTNIYTEYNINQK